MIEPLLHRLLIRPDKLEDADPTYKKLKEMGFERAPHEDVLRERAGMDRGIVLAIGTTAFRDFGGEPNCQVGDYVAYARHAGKWEKDPDTGEDLLIINDEDVVCRITNTKKDA